MRRYLTGHRIHTAVVVILSYFLASCGAGGPAGPAAPPIALSATSIVFSNENSQTITLTNLESEPIEWRVVASSASWLTASPTTGMLGPRGNGSITVQVNRQAVPAGTHSAEMRIGAPRSPVSLNVSVQPPSSARAALEPEALTIGSSEATGTLQLSNSGNSELDWTLSGPAWLTTSPASGRLAPGGNTRVVVTPVRSQLTTGYHITDLQLTSNGGSDRATVTVEAIGVSGLRLEPADLDFGISGTQLQMRIVNETSHSLDWDAKGGSGWIGLSKSSGNLPPGLGQLITVSASRNGLPHGTSESPILFTTNEGSTTASVRVTVPTASAPGGSSSSAEMRVTPLSLNFGDAATELTVQVQNEGSERLDWSGHTDAGWLSLSPAAGHVSAKSSGSLTAQVNRSGLTPGTYRSTITLRSPVGMVTILVEATVKAGAPTPAPKPPPSVPPPPVPPPPQEVKVTPALLSFGSEATELSFKIENLSEKVLNWTGQTADSWVKLPVPEGSVAAGGSQTVKVRVSRAGLSAAGQYVSAVQVQWEGATTSVEVSLVVPDSSEPPPPPPPPPGPPELAVSPIALSFGLTQTQLSFRVHNVGGSALSWSAQPANAWISLSVSGGQLAAGDSQGVAVQVSRSGLSAAGTYQSTIQLSSNGGSSSLPVTLQVPSLPPPPPTGGSSVNVRDFGARGNGLSDDSPAFERAIEALPASGGTVVVPTGTYLLEPRFLSPVRPLSLIEKTNISIVGQGMDSTILKMVNGSYPSSTFMIVIMKSSGIQIQDLTFDMNRDGSWYGDEQSHIARVEASQDVRFSNVRFTNSPGDGIKFIGLGELGDPWVDRAWVENSVFFNLWRNGVTIQRGVRNLQIRSNTFERVSQQSISSEPTGFDGAATDILIENNLIRHFSGSYSIALSGGGSLDPIKRLTFRNNTVDNGAVFFLWVDGIQVEGNTLRGGPKKAALRLQDISGGLVANNIITGNEDGASAVLQLLNDAEALSHDVTVRDNRVDARAGGTGIHVRDGGGQITVAGNDVLGSGTSRGITFETLVSGVGLRSGYTVMNNDVQNFKDAIAFIARGDQFANVKVASNITDHDQEPAVDTIGILFDRTGSPETFAEVVGNIFGAGIRTPLRVLLGG